MRDQVIAFFSGMVGGATGVLMTLMYLARKRRW